jgi:uncharacterized protein YyaL (SSP411 family)
MAAAIDTVYQPNRVVVFRPEESPDAVARLAPYTREQSALDGGRATAYVCREFACRQPTSDVQAMIRMLTGES